MDSHISEIYSRRFEGDVVFRDKMWKVLCRNFFQKFIPKDSIVLELGAGYCEFINNINARIKIAVDINPETIKRALPGINVITCRSIDMSDIQSNSVDRIFVSNFFEHITKEEMLLTLKECSRVLVAGGKMLVLQPNIRYIYKDYWMFFDHISPIDDRALCEALEILGFNIEINISRFLPYTTKSALPKSIRLVNLYLKIPLLWKIFGGQAFVVARK